MAGRLRIVRIRRDYNRWVANQTLEDFALRFTAKAARRWSAFRVAHTALAAISFLALEAIGGAITLKYGFVNAGAAILVVGALIFATGLPIGYYAARDGVDIDLLTRGAGFGYIGSTITSLIYASFTFIFFAIEAAIMAMALEMCLGIPQILGYLVSSLVVIPLVTHGITFISRLQLWTQPVWIALNIVPFLFVAATDPASFEAWTGYHGTQQGDGAGFDLLLFGAASSVIFSLVAQIGEQVDFLRFLPPRERVRPAEWWAALIGAGAGWILPGGLKLLAGSFLAVLALRQGVSVEHATEPTRMYGVAFGYAVSPQVAIGLTGIFVVLSQLKINVTNSYAGSIAWSNFFSRLTHSHPGRVVWLVFNVAIAFVLMAGGIYKMLEQTLGLYAVAAVAWIGAIVADLVVNKPLGLSPPYIEFKRAHLYDINPVGVGAMALATLVAALCLAGVFGAGPRAFAPFVALASAFLIAPVIAVATRGRYYIARKARPHWRERAQIVCSVCEHGFEGEDMAFCPAYSGPICSLCCSLDARCHDLCKPKARLSAQVLATLGAALPPWMVTRLNSRLGHYLGVMAIFLAVIAVTLTLVYLQATFEADADRALVRGTLSVVFLIFLIVGGIAGWLFVLAQESRRVAENESARQNTLLLREVEAHRRTDAQLQRAKEVAEAANQAKSRYVVGLSHELRTPLNAVLGYAQLLERDADIPAARQGGIRVIRRSAEHLASLIDGLLDIAKIESGRLQLDRDEVRLRGFLDQLADMFRLQAQAKGLAFVFEPPPRLPEVVFTDEKRLRQVLINLLSNAIKFTHAGRVALRLTYRNEVAEFAVEDTGPGIAAEDLERIFEPFERGSSAAGAPGIGLGLTITKVLAEIMGGDLSVASTPGRGTVFRVRVMLSAVANPSRSTPAEKRILGYAGARRTVMVVDDTRSHRDLVREILSPLGFTVLTAEGGPSCLATVAHCRPDLFLVDISMPVMNGWELATRLRREGHVDAAIVLMSANIGERRPARGDDDDHDAVLPKPFDLHEFLDQIRLLLDLEWFYEAPAPPPARAETRASPGSVHVKELLRLGRIGYVRGVEAKLVEIAALDPEAEPLVTELRDLVRAFDFRGYLSVLEGLDDGG